MIAVVRIGKKEDVRELMVVTRLTGLPEIL